jgi:cytosine/adenosine deaminase-related metal-dependent hydrolase
MLKLFRNGKILYPDFSIKKANLLIQDDIIYDIFPPEEVPLKPIDADINLEGQIIFPGLINAHDHLVDTCWQGLGATPVENWYDWDTSVKESDSYKAMQKLSVTDLYTLGMYKNVISGATTVVDHFPSEVSKTFQKHQLVSLLEHYYLTHSVSSHQLHWGRNISEEFKNASGIIPFILHIGQGTSKEIREELETLNRLGALGENTILVDGCFLTENDLQLIASKRSSMVWLPKASQRIFAKQPDIEKILELKIPLTIGTDSSVTGSADLLSELRVARDICKNHFNDCLNGEQLLKMVTLDAAKIFGIEKLAGSIEPGKSADFVIFEEAQNCTDHFEHFINLNTEDLSMVVHKGAMVIGNEEFRSFASVDFSLYSEVRFNNSSKILFGRPIQLMDRICHKLDMDLKFPFFPVSGEE